MCPTGNREDKQSVFALLIRMNLILWLYVFLPFAAASSNALAKGDVPKAIKKAQLARKVAMAAFIIGFTSYIILVIVRYCVS